MLQWLRRFLDKHFTRVIYSPEVAQLGVIGDKDWGGLLAELAQGYEKHKPVFMAVQILLRQAEREAFRTPTLKTPEELTLWQAEQLAAVREVNLLRRILRLPIEGQKMLMKKAQAEAAKKEREEEEADLN